VQTWRTSHKVSCKEKVSRARECNYGDLRQYGGEVFSSNKTEDSQTPSNVAKVVYTICSVLPDHLGKNTCEVCSAGRRHQTEKLLLCSMR
jgi:hypothetical protein